METFFKTKKVKLFNKLVIINEILILKYRYEDNYTLEIEFIDGNTGITRKSTHDSSVARYFDENGTLCTNIFYKYLSQYLTNLLESKKAK